MKNGENFVTDCISAKKWKLQYDDDDDDFSSSIVSQSYFPTPP